MTELVVSEVTLRSLTEELGGEVERGAVLFLNHDVLTDRYLVQSVKLAVAEDCTRATGTQITFAPEFLVRVTRQAKESNRSIGLLHTHPAGFVEFSATDDDVEAGLSDFFRERLSGLEALSLVLCAGRLLARRCGSAERIAVRVVGSNISIDNPHADQFDKSDRYDRQVRAFGEEGQAVLRNLEVAVVGLGGTGSVVAQQLAHLGVGKFLLIDGDVIEKSNLNRVVGAQSTSVGLSKVDSACKLIQEINRKAEVQRYVGSAMTEGAARLLRGTNCIFICTDSHVSRAFLSEFSYQYLIPAFDIGVSINASNGRVDAVTGRTQMLAPGLPCLSCSNSLDTRRIREELMTPEQRAADPYFNDGAVQQPAVISINSVMTSLAVTMFLGAFTAIPARARWQSYDALSGMVRALSTRPDTNCGVCGAEGVMGAGDSRSLTLLQPEHG